MLRRQAGEKTAQHAVEDLRLHAENDIAARRRGRLRRIGDRAAAPRGERIRFLARRVVDDDLLRRGAAADGLGDRAAHVARADECDGSGHCDRSFFAVLSASITHNGYEKKRVCKKSGVLYNSGKKLYSSL